MKALPPLRPFKNVPPPTSKEEVWHFHLLGWQIVNLDVSRKYSDIKVMQPRADKMDNPQQSGISSLNSAYLSFNLFFFFKKTFLETLITVEGWCKAGKEIDHFYSVVRDKM